MTSDWDGRRYDEVNGLQRWVADQSLAVLHLRGDERVLDVGCGDGRATVELAARLPRGSVVGVDPSTRMLDVARSRVTPATPNLSFATGTAEALRYDSEFDVVVSFNALHWVGDLGAAMRRIRAAMVDDGTAYLQLVCEGERPSVEDVTLAVTRRAPYSEHLGDREPAYHHRMPGEIVEAAEEGGLRLLSERVDDLTWDFGDPEALLAWLRVGFGDWLSPLPDEASREALLAEAARDYAAVAGSATAVRFLQLRDRFTAE